MHIDLSMFRNRKTNSQPRTEVAMVPIQSTTNTDNNYDTSGGSYEEPNPANTNATTNQTNNDIVYINVQVSSAPGAGAAGGLDNGNVDYERLDTHGSSPEAPPAYEVIQNRTRPHAASTI